MTQPMSSILCTCSFRPVLTRSTPPRSLYGRRRKREQTEEHLSTAATMFREMEMRVWMEQAEADLVGEGPRSGEDR